MKYCKFCNSEYTNNTNTHNRWCQGYKNFVSQCEQICTKEFLIREYHDNGKSFAAISRELGLSKDRLVKRIFRDYGLVERTEYEWQHATHKMELRRQAYLRKYGVEEMFSSQEVRDTINNTILEKYGVSNVGCDESIKQKIEQTMIARYGEKTSLMNPVVREKIKDTVNTRYGVSHIQQHKDIRDKRNATMLSRYGVLNPCENDKILEKALRKRYSTESNNLLYSNKSQLFFNKVYDKLPPYIQEQCYFANKNKEYFFRSETSIFFVDFVIPKYKYALEYNGDYFHAIPSKYEKNYFNKKLKLTAMEIWDRDIKRYCALSRSRYKLDIVWESRDSDIEVERIVKSITEYCHSNSHK